MKYAPALVFIITLIPASLLASEVYRWTDDAGNTHYSEDPPSGVDAEPVDIQTSSPSTPDAAPSETETEEESEQENEEGASEEERPDKEAVEEARRRNCENARKALETLQQNARVQVEDDGERRYLSPEEKEAEEERYKELRDDNCD